MIANVAEFCPAATVTEAAVDALEEFDDKLTAIPPIGAAPLSITVPVAETPQVTDDGEMDTPVGTGARTVRFAEAELPFALAEMARVAFFETGIVVTLKVVVNAPEGTVTVDGTVAHPLFELRLTVIPPAGAAALS